MGDFQKTELTLGAAMFIAALGVLGFAMIGSYLGKWIGSVWPTLLAILSLSLLAYHPIIGGSLTDDLSTDLLRRILIGFIPFTILLCALSFTAVPHAARIAFAVIGPPLLLYCIFCRFDTQVPRRDFFLYKVLPVSAVMMAAWAMVEPIAVRTPGAAAPIIAGPITAGVAYLLTISTELQAGLMSPIIPATAMGALLAAITAFFLRKHVTFARGPVLLWFSLTGAMFAFMWFDTENMPSRYLCWIATALLLGWIPETKPIHRLKPWKRESIRLVLVSIPVIIAVALAWKQHHDQGDEYGLAVLPDRARVEESCAGTCFFERNQTDRRRLISCVPTAA